MSGTVGVNKRTVVHAGSAGTSVAFPDVCLTPAPPSPSPVPIPYPNIARSADSASTAQDVVAEGNPICLASSNFARTSGNEPGTAGGVVSGVNMGKATFVQYSFDVQIEGQGVPRALDLMLHNSNNTPPFPLVQAPMNDDNDDFSFDEEEAPDNALESAEFV